MNAPRLDPLTKDFLKKQLNKFATKTELKNETKAIRKDLLRLEERIENIEGNVDDIKITLKKNTDILVDIAGKLDDLRTENIVGANQIYELRKQTDALEKRIKKLEKSHRN